MENEMVDPQGKQFFSMDEPSDNPDTEPSSFSVPPNTMSVYELAHLRMLSTITYSLADIANSLRKLTRQATE